MKKLLRRILSPVLGQPVPALSREAVRWGYRLFLDRDPETEAVLDDKARRLGTIRELRQELLESDEFRYNNPAIGALSMTGHEPPLDIERVDSDEDMTRLFDHVQKTWRHFGETEAYWSVLTAPQFLEARFEEKKDVFFQSGEKEVERLFDTLRRNDLDASALETCLEYGCGVGRVTLWLAKRFAAVHGYDISAPHLSKARSFVTESGLDHVQLHHLERLEDLDRLPTVDVVYCFIVLQHNPPPVTAFVLRRLLRALRPGGVAFFQVPTYQRDYSFRVADYLARTAEPEIEMHVLPQREVFRIVDEEGCRPVEMFADGKGGTAGPEHSHTFLVRKER